MAYGPVPGPEKAAPLHARLYMLPSRAITKERVSIVAWPIECASSGKVPPSLAERLQLVFNDELKRGVTYPQRGPMAMDEFRAYFLSYDLIVGVLLSEEQTVRLTGLADKEAADEQVPRIGVQVGIPAGFFDTIAWNDAYGFSYYIKVSIMAERGIHAADRPSKPNYPGRSSHLCNAGFVVPPSHRGLGLGGVAALSFLHYAPRCGYQGSVFNLVYANNEASVRIWERLGFTRVGKIPKAGLLQRADGEGEEYTDAWVIHGDFERLGDEGVTQP